MADDAERMVALKKAYADIILNTAKESAARILAAERRAVQSQKSLSAAKEEALAMLLRLKAIMDSKDVIRLLFDLLPVCEKWDLDIKEAEMRNISQARKIQELEVQLREAKHTIHYLNSELKKVSSESESEKRLQSVSLEKKVKHNFCISLKDGCQVVRHTCASAPSSVSGTICSPNSDLHVRASSWGPLPDSCLPKDTTEENSSKDLIASDDSVGNPDLVSLILRNKEPDLCRNGCTQRIRALEQNIVTGRELPTQKHTKLSDARHIELTYDDKLAERQRIQEPALEVELAIPVKEPFGTEKVGHQSNNTYEDGEKVKLSRRRSIRKRARNLLTSSCRSYHNKEEHEQSYMSSSIFADQNSMSMSCENQGDKIENTHYCLDLASLDRNTKLNKLSNHVIPEILNGKGIMTRRAKKLCEIKSDNHCGGTTTSIGLDFGQENIKREEITMSTFDVEDGVPLHESVNSDALDKQLECDQMLTVSRHKVEGSLITSDSKMNHQNIDVPLNDCGSKDDGPCKSSGHSTEVVNERVVKYTFKRTRKKRSPDSKNETATSEENNKSKRKADNEITLLESSKPNIENESTRDSRRLAQVARQRKDGGEQPYTLMHKQL